MKASSSNVDVASWVESACLLEARAPKPGNVHPGASFVDMTHDDLVRSAHAIGEVFRETAAESVGHTILEAVKATKDAVGRNTNLGICILLAPLARLGSGCEPAAKLRLNVRRILARLTQDDAALVYEAIRLAAPAGLGETTYGDIRNEPPGTLLQMMELAADKDLVARQYANAYCEVINEGLADMEGVVRRGLRLDDATVWTFLGFLERHGDSLVERKCGPALSAEAALRAARVRSLGWPEAPQARRQLSEFDSWLRQDGHRRNPGTSADLSAAVLFLALRNGIIPPVVPPRRNA